MHDELDYHHEIRDAYLTRCTTYSNALHALNRIENVTTLYAINTRAILREERNRRVIMTLAPLASMIAFVGAMCVVVALLMMYIH